MSSANIARENEEYPHRVTVGLKSLERDGVDNIWVAVLSVTTNAAKGQLSHHGTTTVPVREGETFTIVIED